MSQSIRINSEAAPAAEWEDVVRQGLYRHNRAKTGSREIVRLSVLARDAQGQVVGGVLGESIWGWMLIETLWVHEELRGQGYGRQLMLEAEKVARERGCTHITLETFSFQALPFYQKLGYVIYGALDGFPPGQTRYSLKKDLLPAGELASAAPSAQHQTNLYQYNIDSSSLADAYSSALYSIIIDLLNRHDQSDLLNRIVEHAATILDAPFGEIMLREGEELVVKAFTSNQPNLAGDRVKRGEALVTWRAFDSQQPVLIDDYFNWSGKRVLYDDAQLRAVADFPIMLGENCLGVLAMARTVENHPFKEMDVRRGMQFAQLVAVVLDNANLYEVAQQEIRERRMVEQALRLSFEELKGAQQQIQAQNDTLIQTNRDLEVARIQADAANQLKSQFLATMSHELRTPLNAIIGYAQLLSGGLTGDVTPEQRAFQERIIVNAHHLLYLINQVLDISKIEAGRMELAEKPYDVRKALQEVERQNRILADNKHLDFAITVDAEVPEKLVGDETRIKQIVINLVGNAIKFTDRGSVHVKAVLHEQTEWRILVQDTGVGISPTLQQIIFDEFRQADEGVQRGGTGLGLAISQKLIRLMGGTIRVESEVGRGSTFIVTLPLTVAVPSALSTSKG
ncbi:MAG: GNAT family N-acetyltransferase [Anaerolineae bacterium]|nr:GNAT family N-acetyltransferase [Anaerolineae bacterium]